MDASFLKWYIHRIRYLPDLTRILSHGMGLINIYKNDSTGLVIFWLTFGINNAERASSAVRGYFERSK